MRSVCASSEPRRSTAIVGPSHGAIAQVVERLHGMQEVEGSNPSSSTPRALGQALRLTASTLAGVFAAEGWFTVTQIGRYRDGSAQLRFRLGLTMAARDRALVEALHSYLGVGSIQEFQRNPRWQRAVVFTVSSRRANLARSVPFLDEFLEPCAKRAQYETWRDRLLAHEAAHPSRWRQGP